MLNPQMSMNRFGFSCPSRPVHASQYPENWISTFSNRVFTHFFNQVLGIFSKLCEKISFLFYYFLMFSTFSIEFCPKKPRYSHNFPRAIISPREWLNIHIVVEARVLHEQGMPPLNNTSANLNNQIKALYLLRSNFPEKLSLFWHNDDVVVLEIADVVVSVVDADVTGLLHEVWAQPGRVNITILPIYGFSVEIMSWTVGQVSDPLWGEDTGYFYPIHPDFVSFMKLWRAS